MAEIRTSLGREIEAGLREALADAEGRIKLPRRILTPMTGDDVKAVRRATGLSQSEFAALYGVPAGTLKNFEQGRRTPDAVARAYLTAIGNDPQAVLKALKTIVEPAR